MATREEIREGIARRLYERTANQLLLANYFGNEPTYDVKWDTLSDDAKTSWLEDADNEMAELHSQGVMIKKKYAGMTYAGTWEDPHKWEKVYTVESLTEE